MGEWNVMIKPDFHRDDHAVEDDVLVQGNETMDYILNCDEVIRRDHVISTTNYIPNLALVFASGGDWAPPTLLRNPFLYFLFTLAYTNKTSLFRKPILKPKAMVSITTDAEEKQKPWLLVGLGNPGKRYSGTRHNIGFELVDFIAEAEGSAMSLLVPLFHIIPLNQVLVMFREVETISKGGHAGHNGMRSIINHFKGSRDFPRLRIGIGRPPGKMDPVNFVLRPFSREECEELDFTFRNGLEAVRLLVGENFNKSATFVNSAKSVGTL